MKLNNIGGFETINEYVEYKLQKYSAREKTMGSLFECMFSERDNVFAEITDGYKIKKFTYGEFYDGILAVAPSVKAAIGDAPYDSLVGIYMGNSMEWIKVFWSVLIAGYRPLLMNTRLDDAILERLLADHGVCAVISDEKRFSVKTLIAREILVETTPATLETPFGTQVLFMSSGTTDRVKLCAYTGENFYYQVASSVDIVARCPAIAQHYEGELKQLTLLPFYHVFGFIAVYLWFGFFSRSFVFLRDLNPNTLLNTVRRHKVTHIFAVPLVWDTIYKEALKKIRAKGDKTYGKFSRVLKICNATGGLGARLGRALLGEVRDNLFGDSICFMISGGSAIDSRVLSFFNGIGYPLANGYGMTEIGITSLEVSAKKPIRNSASVGVPFLHMEYRLSETGELWVRGRTMASEIITPDETFVTDFDEWFNTHDRAKIEDGRYYLLGRSDDVIICENGENINPDIVESRLLVEGCEAVCLFADQNQEPVLLASIRACFSGEELNTIRSALENAIREAHLDGAVKRVELTTTPLRGENDFKVSRRRVAKRYARGEFKTIAPEQFGAHAEALLSHLERELCAYFAEVLEIDADAVDVDADFFTQLGGSSLAYFSLLNLIQKNYGVTLSDLEGQKLYTVRAFFDFLTNWK